MSGRVKGWCPGALRPMMTGDGWLVRLRPSCGIIPATLALEIADCAEEHGNGLIELTNRANVQLRGIRLEALATLQDRLAAHGLLDFDAVSEAVRNIIASPLAGVDPLAALDIRPVVAALEARLSSQTALHELPGKFGFVVGDGGCFDMANVAGDIAFLAYAGPKGAAFAVHVAGQSEPVGFCAPGDVADIAGRLASAFLHTGCSRFRDVVVVDWRAIVARGQTGAGTPAAEVSINVSGLQGVGHKLFPPHKQLAAGSASGFLAIGKAFGRWQAQEWRGLALAALQRVGAQAELRLTPWRHILLPWQHGEHAALLMQDIAAFGGIFDPSDKRLWVAACPGAPACTSASTTTQSDALALAHLVHNGAPHAIALHVSGCGKGCARQARTPVTFVARDGLYDLVLDGTAQDRAILSQLTLADAAAALRGLAAGASAMETP